MFATAGEPYFLKSRRLGFRWWSRNDLPFARGLWGQREVTRFFGGPFPEEEIQRRLQVELDRAAAHNFQYWPIHLLEGGEFVGCSGLRPYKLEEGIPELGFHLRPEFWGRGLAPEAATAVIHYAFETLGVKRAVRRPSSRQPKLEESPGSTGFPVLAPRILPRPRHRYSLLPAGSLIQGLAKPRPGWQQAKTKTA